MTNKQKLQRYIPALIVLIIGSIWVINQNMKMPYREAEGFVFGTIYKVSYQYDKDLKADFEKELKLVDEALSMFNENSIISKVNRNENVKLNEMFVNVFDLAKTISKDTDGAFDITVAPLVNAWGFGFKNDIKPSAETIDSLRQFVGYEKVKLIGGKMIKKDDPRLMIDCSAIAKGYGVDAVAGVLKRAGVKNFMVYIGGEIVVSGKNSRQEPWRIGIEKPVDDSLAVASANQAVIDISDIAMATSGNYRNFYYKNGKKYAHTIDPKTGQPVQHNILSATVFAKTCAQADAYATSFMVMGLDKAKEILSRHNDLKAVLIYDHNGSNKIWKSEGLKIEE